jgi:hypothetical protein
VSTAASRAARRRKARVPPLPLITRPERRPRRRVPVTAVLAGAPGLALIAAAFALTRTGHGGAEATVVFWLGMVITLAPIAARLFAADTTRRDRIGLVVLLGALTYAIKVLHDPITFVIGDELVHVAAALDLALVAVLWCLTAASLRSAWRGYRALGLALFATVVSAAWLVLAAPEALGYLGSVVSRTATGIRQALQGGGRVPFETTSFNTFRWPLPEQLASYAAVLLLGALAVVVLWRYRRPGMLRTPGHVLLGERQPPPGAAVRRAGHPDRPAPRRHAAALAPASPGGAADGRRSPAGDLRRGDRRLGVTAAALGPAGGHGRRGHAHAAGRDRSPLGDRPPGSGRHLRRRRDHRP